jgi:hypothetical protein
MKLFLAAIFIGSELGAPFFGLFPGGILGLDLSNISIGSPSSDVNNISINNGFGNWNGGSYPPSYPQGGYYPQGQEPYSGVQPW